MKSKDPEHIIDLRNVWKVYQTGAGEVPVLKDVSMQVGRGSFVSVIGPSGSGKSTLLNMITGIDRPTRGEVFVDGQAIHLLTENQLARWRGRKIGVVFQFFQLLPTLTILENVKLPMDFCNYLDRGERKRRALELLDQVGILPHADKLPSALSGGEQQRAAIARAMANDPQVIVADEPTGNLDSATTADVFDLFEMFIEEGKTLLIVTHDEALSRKTDREIKLLDGRISLDRINHKGTSLDLMNEEHEPQEEVISVDLVKE